MSTDGNKFNTVGGLKKTLFHKAYKQCSAGNRSSNVLKHNRA